MKLSEAQKGKKHTDETKKVIKEKRALQIMTPESYIARAKSNTGKKRTDAFRVRMRDMKKGIPLSEEHKDALKKAHWSKNPYIAEKVRQKISESKKNRGDHHA